jgi:hypothetical protein
MITRMITKLIMTVILVATISATGCHAKASDDIYERCARMVQNSCLEHCLENGSMPSFWQQLFILAQECDFNVLTIYAVLPKLQLD